MNWQDIFRPKIPVSSESTHDFWPISTYFNYQLSSNWGIATTWIHRAREAQFQSLGRCWPAPWEPRWPDLHQHCVLQRPWAMDQLRTTVFDPISQHWTIFNHTLSQIQPIPKIPEHFLTSWPVFSESECVAFTARRPSKAAKMSLVFIHGRGTCTVSCDLESHMAEVFYSKWHNESATNCTASPARPLAWQPHWIKSKKKANYNMDVGVYGVYAYN